VAIEPDHKIIAPEGMPLAKAKAVVAIWVVFVPAAAVGAVGVPVKAGDTEEIAPLNVAFVAFIVVAVTVVAFTVVALAVVAVKVPFTIKFPDVPVFPA
jgi:hypothetical protein